jgi:Holliday junction DNA helicase RuvA
MIARLRGTLVEKHPNLCLVECGGVGYEVSIPVSTFSALPEVGREAVLRIHTHVREDALQLFGFALAEEKSLFEKLIGISGIGPKLAITVLSGVAATQLVEVIRTGDVQRLVKIPGIGKKTAERIILELRDKLDLTAPAAARGAVVLLSPLEEDVISALLNLGSQRPAAEVAVRKALSTGTPAEFEPLFRKALELVR